MDVLDVFWRSLTPESKQILIDILGVLIGFTAVMAALSLLVTAVVQGIIYVFHLRARNLRYGLTRLLEIAQNQVLEPSLVEDYRAYAAKDIAKQETKKIVTSLKKAKASQQAIIAAEEGHAKALLAFNKAEQAKQRLEKLRSTASPKRKISHKQWKQFKKQVDGILSLNSLVIKSKTWIRRNELETLLVESTEFDNENIDKAMQWFTRMERWLSQRFRQRLRCITLTCAIVVTFIFQVNTPELLRRLSVDPKKRIEVAQIALDRMFSEQAAIFYQPNLQMVAVLALQQLQENNPQYQETLEAVSGTGDRIENLVHELSVVLEQELELEDSEHKEALLSEYEETILSEVRKLSAANADKAVESLALIDITPLSRGWNYYANVSSLFGMLMTAVLIGFGAPFWFNMMRNLMSLHDVLAPEKVKKKSKTSDASNE